MSAGLKCITCMGPAISGCEHMDCPLPAQEPKPMLILGLTGEAQQANIQACVAAGTLVLEPPNRYTFGLPTLGHAGLSFVRVENPDPTTWIIHATGVS